MQQAEGSAVCVYSGTNGDYKSDYQACYDLRSQAASVAQCMRAKGSPPERGGS
jgi:hypothetical protein